MFDQKLIKARRLFLHEAFTLMSRRDAESEEFHFTIRIITGLVMRQCQSVTSFNGSGGGKIQFKPFLFTSELQKIV